MKLPQTNDTRTLEDEKILWRTRNRRVLVEIAEKLGISYTYVRLVFLGEEKSGEMRVEKELKQRGCPGF